ncbi:hypothetical protein DCAR_0207449 [Daucus carota subsp. sativus]|uniref:DYW domain-containing protein n=1 Tax=Daucus carota subsp. sativus TaxID=79200 RepID=A0AAF1AQ67_DAUCS|nr:PREDICTED: putative pentatricopeptide repeat-containing protein At3g49142 [Daucus carota subsp. sativus]WOG88215.1 hypothetical protein DCAR_0207449 [Daucus carota subsp. sativus]
MSAITSSIRISRHFLTTQQIQTLVTKVHSSKLPQQNNAFLTETVCKETLDKLTDVKTLQKLHSKIILNQTLSSESSIAIKLMRSYAAFGQPRITRYVFDKSPDKNVVFFNVMIRSYMNNHFYNDALVVFKSMADYDVVPDHYTYPCVLKACSGSGNLWVGLQVHGPVVKVGLDLNLFVGNGLIAMYGKCGCLVDAYKVLNSMPVRDVVSWNSMVVGYAQNGRFDDALEVCRDMQISGVKPDSGTMASLLPAVTNTSIENVMVVNDMFVNHKESLVSWNVMIAVYVNNSMPTKAIDIYLQMEFSKMEPDAITLASVLPACGDLAAILIGRRIHEYVEQKGLRPNLLLENALIDMYAKCGTIEEARKVFDRMQFRDVVSWTSMISAYGMSGQGCEAVGIFDKMRDSGLAPDSIAFVSVLSACSHAGLLVKGEEYFKLMTREYKILPRLEHFACMVDLLGRAGRLNEAYSVIKQMPMKPNERIWGALLSACRVYSNMDIGLVAADNLFQMVPEQAAYYVLLSNIYAKAGRWKDVTVVRSIMKSKGIKKLPGVSNVELHDHVHSFLAGDQSHPQSKEIYEELDVLVWKMKEAGYVPETESALHDVEEEDKENHLAVHSEKLAIAFVILNTKPGTPIRITKNLRVCGDCHIAAKLISKITNRDIIVRDTNRFHHFHNGVCSCGDYW